MHQYYSQANFLNNENFAVVSEPLPLAELYCYKGVACADIMSKIAWGDQAAVGVFKTSGYLKMALRST